MSTALTTLDRPKEPSVYGHTQQQFVTMQIGNQWFGISVMSVQDVLRNLQVSPIPMAPPAIAGALNIRGRIVTAIDMRKRLGIEESNSAAAMFVVVESDHELFALMVDAVGDVLSLSMREFEAAPANLDAAWRSIAAGVFKLKKGILVIMDVVQLIDGCSV